MKIKPTSVGAIFGDVTSLITFEAGSHWPPALGFSGAIARDVPSLIATVAGAIHDAVLTRKLQSNPLSLSLSPRL